jgi:hypothetical protein
LRKKGVFVRIRFCDGVDKREVLKIEEMGLYSCDKEEEN